MKARPKFESLSEAQDRAWREQQAADAAHAARGPEIAECCECGASAPYARNNFRRAPQAAEWFCERHAPDSLKRPGDFLKPNED